MSYQRTPDFINHYINQYISEECISRLNQLAKAYINEKNTIEENIRNTAANREEYKKLRGQYPYDYDRARLKELESETRKQALIISKEEAKKVNLELIEWQEPQPQKDVAQKIEETEKHLENSQDKMLEQKAKAREEEIAALKKKWEKNKEMTKDRRP